MSAPRKPTDLELWLCRINVGKLEVVQRMTGCDMSETYWVLTPTDAFGETKGQEPPKRILDRTVKPLVDVAPDHCAVLRPRREVRKAVDEWNAFAAEESADLAEYERLKAKFG